MKIVQPMVSLVTAAKVIPSWPPPTQCGPSASCPVVFVPIGGPSTMPLELVSTVTESPVNVGVNRSRPRGAGPPFFSPTRLYCEPWHGHSNHCDVDAARHTAAEVHALLVQEDEALLHAGDDRRRVRRHLLRLLERARRIVGDPHASLGEVAEALAGVDGRPGCRSACRRRSCRRSRPSPAARGSRCTETPNAARLKLIKVTTPRLRN